MLFRSALVGSDLARTRAPAGGNAGGAGTGGANASRIRDVAWVAYSMTPPVEECQAGMLDELAKLGWRDGTEIRIQRRDAQLDVATMNTMASAIADQHPDLVCTFTTVALQSVMRRVERIPIVFSLVADPVLAGAGTSAADHRANVTGVGTVADFARMADTVQAIMPRAKVIGTVFCPGEINSVFSRDRFQEVLAARGITLVSAAADRATDFSQAADTLVARRVDLIVQVRPHEPRELATYRAALLEHAMPLGALALREPDRTPSRPTGGSAAAGEP